MFDTIWTSKQHDLNEQCFDNNILKELLVGLFFREKKKKKRKKEAKYGVFTKLQNYQKIKTLLTKKHLPKNQ